METGESLSEDDIVALVTNATDDSKDTSSVDEYDPEPRIVTAAEVQKGLVQVIQFAEKQEWCTGKVILWLRDIRREIETTYQSQLKQTAIELFFIRSSV